MDAAGVAAALARAGAGRVAGDDAFIERAAVERLAAGAGVSDDWNGRYEGMLAYAAKKGWLDDDGAVPGPHRVVLTPRWAAVPDA